MNTDNILSFPKDKIVREGVNIEPVRKAQEKSAKNFADSVVEEACDAIMDIFNEYGLDLEGEFFKRDICLAETILQAAVYRSLEIEHRIHAKLNEEYAIMDAKEKAGIDTTEE